MAANQVDFKILPSDQFSVYSPATRSDKVITYFTLLSKLRGDILSVGQDDDPNNIVSAFYSSVGGTQTLHLVKADGSEVTASVPEPTVGTVTSVDLTASTGISVSGGPITTSGSITVTNTAPDQVVVLTGAGTTSISGTYPSFTITSNDQFVGTVTSVGLTMPAAFSVANSPVTASGTLAVTAAGLSSQYIRGDGQLANFPTPGGGGSSVNYYLNGSVSQGTFGGDTYYELSKTPIAGAGTNFTRAHGSGNGYIASFITDANDPDQINIPGGNFNLEFYFNSSSSGGSPAFYGELYKVSVSNVFTLIASGSVNPESITGGTTVDQYYTSIAVPQTALLSTDRLAIRVYVIVSGKNITLHTENSNFSEVITTFSTGLNSLNGLSDQVQYFAVGTSGTDFAISSSVDTHTFNLPTASATNRGALSSADWTTFNGKASDAFKTIAVTGQSDIVADNATDTLNIVAGSGVTLTTNDTTDTLTISATGSGGTVTSVDLTAGTGISVSGGPITGSGFITVNNTAPDQTVVLTASTGITTSGTYPNFTIANSAPDQTVVLTGGTGITTSGTYPSFTVTNSAPDQTVVLTAGTGITTSGTYPSFTVTNSAPDQTVALTAGTGISISGTYPSFTITNTSAGGGTITGSGTTNYVPKWTSASAIGDSVIYDDGTNVGINTTTPTLNTSGRVLHINAPSNQASIVHFTNATTGALANDGLIVGRWDDGINYLFTYENEPLHFGTNTSIRMVITAAGNVGIGNTAPNQKLELSVGNAVTGGLRINYDAVATSEGMDITYLNSGNTTTSFDSRYNSDSAVMQFRMKTAATAVNAMTILGNGNIGINTTAPGQKLQVDGNIYVNDDGTTGNGIMLRGADRPLISRGWDAFTSGNKTGIGRWGVYMEATELFIGAPGTDYSNALITLGGWLVNGTRQPNLTLNNSTQRVGIGNTAPSEKLHVTGNIRVTGAYYDSANAAGTSGQILSSTGTGTSWIAAPSGGGITGSGTTNYVTKWTSSSAVGNSVIYDDGTNVGINTALPGTKLDVAGNGRFSNGASGALIVKHNYSFGQPNWGIKIDGDTSTSGGYLSQYINIGGFELAQGGTYYGAGNYRTDANSTSFSAVSGYDGIITFSTNGSLTANSSFTASERMRITSAGNVGIGTTAPNRKTEIIEASGATLGVSTSGSGVGILYGRIAMYSTVSANAYINYGGEIRSYSGAGVDISDLRFSTCSGAGSTERMRILSNGNLGIGTPGPVTKLEVYGGHSDTTARLYSTGNGSGSDASLDMWASEPGVTYDGSGIGNNVNGHPYYGRRNTGIAQSYIRFVGGQILLNTGSTTASQTVTVLASGNVGINNTNPSYKLDVTGDAYVSDDLLVGATNATSWHRISIATGGFIAQSGGRGIGAYVDATAAEFFAYNYSTPAYIPLLISSSTLKIANNAGSSIIYHDGTNVGIGITSPLSLLHVAGDARITSGSLGVGVAPNATDGRIDASNDIVAFQTSDIRLKENITPITNALEKVKSLTGVMFDWKEETKSVHGYEGHDVGIIAQDVQAVLPEAVRTNETGYLSVRYEKMIALLIEGMKEQQLQIDELKSKLK